MSTWWIDEVMILLSFNECTLNDSLPPIFEENTMDLFCFNEDYNSGHLARVVAVMNNENVININFLFPWSF